MNFLRKLFSAIASLFRRRPDNGGRCTPSQPPDPPCYGAKMPQKWRTTLKSGTVFNPLEKDDETK